jgi:cyanoexosortase A
LGLIFAIYLTIYWRCNEDINRVFVLGIIYACFFFKFYQKQNEISFSSSLASRLIGLLFIFIPLVRTRFILIMEEGRDFQYLSLVLCLISVIGYIILIADFKGLKKFKKELLFLGVASILIPFISKVFMLTQDRQKHNFLTVISAKTTTFFLWYLGFTPMNQGSMIEVNGGAVDVNIGCTGWALFMILMQLSCCVLFVFRSSLKNPLFPFIISFFISFILSIIRIIILALVVKDKVAFQYWHYDEGANLFTTAGMILFWGIIFLKLPNSLSFEFPPVNFRDRPHPFLLTISVILGLIFLSLSLFFSPITGVNTIASYKFPEKIPLANWKMLANFPSNLTVKTLTPKVSPAQEEDSESKNLDMVMANQIYRYKNNDDLLTVNAHYIVNTSGNIKDYYKKFRELPKLENTIEKQTKDGSSLYFIKDQQPSLTACINYQGKTTATSSQFGRSLYTSASNNFQVFHVLNWLLGQAVLNDKRCLLLGVSINSRSPDRDAQLMGAWTELVSYWQKNFPPLRN